MTNDRLVNAYLEKAAIRIKALHFLRTEKGYSDVVREAQECVELILKALLRHYGWETPKTHDVSRTLQEHRAEMPQQLKQELDEVCRISRQLRKDRELSFYGTDDWIPTEEYSDSDAAEAIQQTEFVYRAVVAALGK